MAQRIGVALSSGGAAGMAHIGVLEELTEAGIGIDCVAGTSAGAMVGAAFAAGQLDLFRDSMLGLSRRRGMRMFDPIWPRAGLLGGRRAMALMGLCASGNIEDLPLPYAAVATDLDSGQRVLLRSGDVCEAVRASIAIPGLLAPQMWRGRLLVDGALVDPVPVAPARELGATFVIAVTVIGSAGTSLRTQRFGLPRPGMLGQLMGRARHALRPTLSPLSELPCELATDALSETVRCESLAAILFKASAVIQTNIAAARLQQSPPDFLIAPDAHAIGTFEVWRAAEAIEAGRAAARAALPELRAAIDAAQARSRSWWNLRAVSSGDRAAA